MYDEKKYLLEEELIWREDFLILENIGGWGWGFFVFLDF